MSSFTLDPVEHNLPAILLSVCESGNHMRHFCAGLADIRQGTSLTANHLFPIGQITQLFTAFTVLKWVETGALDLDMPLELIANRYQLDGGRFKVLINLYSFLKPLTLRELLQQTSGLPAYDETLSYQKIFCSHPKKTWQAENYLDVITGQEVRYRLGYEMPIKTIFSESSTNYVVISLLLEAVSGKKNSAQLSELVTDIKLKDTFYLRYGVIEEEILPRVARGYLPLSHPQAEAFRHLPVLTYHDNRELCVYDVTAAYNFLGLGGRAGLSTTTDLIQTFIALVNGKILRGSFKDMFQVVPVPTKSMMSDMKTYFGLGIYKTISRRYGEIIWHAGNSYGYGVLVAHAVDQNITFALAVNVSRRYIYLENMDVVDEILKRILGSSS